MKAWILGGLVVMFAFQNCAPLSQTANEAKLSSGAPVDGSADYAPASTLISTEPGECIVRGGAGAFISGISNVTITLCQIECFQHNDRRFRTCTFGNKKILEPSPDYKCVIRGGAGRILTPDFYGTFADCDQACTSFAATNPNRTCTFGQITLALRN